MTLKNLTKLPVLRYFDICKVLHIWSIRAIPTYRVGIYSIVVRCMFEIACHYTCSLIYYLYLPPPTSLSLSLPLSLSLSYAQTHSPIYTCTHTCTCRLVIVSRFHPEPVLMSLIHFIAPSRPVVVYCNILEVQNVSIIILLLYIGLHTVRHLL